MTGQRVLVIEDNEMNALLIRELLAVHGFEVLEAESAEKGIKLARAHFLDLILMDIQLPGMDGLTATRIIKDDSVLTGIPVIALTSYAMDGDREKALGAGCIHYISKPINTRTFVEEITLAIAGNRS